MRQTETLLGHVVYNDTERGATYARGWWLVFLPNMPDPLKRVPDSDVRELVGRHFESRSDRDRQADALAAARVVFKQATYVAPGEYGYDIYGEVR